MKSERYRILSLVHTGQLDQDQANILLADLGKRQRRASRTIWTIAFLLTACVVALAFPSHVKIRLIVLQAFETLDRLAIFRTLHVWFQHLLELL